MSNKSSKSFLVFVLIAVVVLVAVFMLKPTSNKLTSESNVDLSDKETVNNKESTIGSEWQWFKKESQISSNLANNNLPFTAESVYRALQAVKLDEDGNVILDHDALLSLDEALERIHNKMDSESLNTLQQLIKKALPGKAGMQTAKLVTDYHQYLQAKQEFSQINEAMADSNNELTAESVEANVALYAELQELREVHIGTRATKKLFRISDANAQYMFDSMKLETNNDLTSEEIKQRRMEIKEKHISLSINVSGWPTRYQELKQQRQLIINSNVGEQQKRKKLKALIQQSFDDDELKRIEHLGLDRI